jgi:hypothetical protein
MTVRDWRSDRAAICVTLSSLWQESEAQQNMFAYSGAVKATGQPLSYPVLGEGQSSLGLLICSRPALVLFPCSEFLS